MKKQYKIQLPKGKKVTMTNVDFENGVMTVNVELENKEEPISEAEKVIKHLRSIDWDKRTKESIDRIRDELYHKKHPETISNYERWKSKFGKINNQLKEVLKHNGSKREKIEEMAKESIKELEKDCPDIWDRYLEKFSKRFHESCEQVAQATAELSKAMDEAQKELNQEQKYEPKEGDFVKIQKEGNLYFTPDLGIGYSEHEPYIGIFKSIETDEGKELLFCYITLMRDSQYEVLLPLEHEGHTFSVGEVSNLKVSPATEAEKKLLIDKLAKANKRWNPNTKQIEDVRWRAKEGEPYSYLLFGDTDILVTSTTDTRMYKDDERFNSGNYFKTDSDAEEVATQIRDIFQNSKAE